MADCFHYGDGRPLLYFLFEYLLQKESGKANLKRTSLFFEDMISL